MVVSASFIKPARKTRISKAQYSRLQKEVFRAQQSLFTQNYPIDHFKINK